MNTEQLKEVMKDPKKMEEQMKILFDALDKDHKGYIEADLLKEHLKQRAAVLGFPPVEPPKEREEAIRKEADPTGTGKVDFNGFKAAQYLVIKHIKEMINDPNLVHSEVKRIFGELDTEKKGYLSIPKIEELEKKVDQFGVPVMFRATEEQKEKLKKIGDPNGTGKLTLEGSFAVADAIVAKMKKDGF